MPASMAPCKKAKVALQVIAACAVIAALGWFVRSIDLPSLWRALRSASLPMVLAAATINFVTILWKATFWCILIKPMATVPLLAMFRYTIAASAGSVLAPARAGELVRMWLLRRHHGVTYPVSGGLFGLEKLGDLMALLCFVLPIPWLLPGLPAWVARGIELVGAMALVAVAVVWVARRWRRVRQWKLLAALQTINEPRRVLLAFGAILASWTTDFVAINLVLRALHIDVPAASSLLVLLGVNMATTVPALPGNLGSHELGAIAALGVVGVSPEQGAAFALVYHMMQVVPVLVVGLIDGRWLLAGRKRSGGESGA